jgi:DNA-binding CsgD family transcriptional regulator/tetratricopeptide (TPR) repeat protein
MTEWPLVGRDEALARAGRVLRPAEGASPGGSVVIVGAAGTGKTRLAQAVMAGVAPERVWLLRAAGSQAAATIPFGALAPLLPPIEAQPNALALLAAVRQDLGARAAGRLIVLHVDDLQLLDPGSATLLHQLVTTGTCRLLGTARSGTLVPDAVESLWRDGDAELVDLGPLDPDGVRTLLDAVLGPPVLASTALTLSRRTGGNPLYLRELVRIGLREGTLSAHGGAWVVSESWTPPARLTEAIGSRLSGLGAPETAAVELLALAGTLSLPALEELAGAEAVETLEALGVVTVTRDGRRLVVQLAHPLYVEVVRAGLPVTRRRRRHRELAVAVQATGARRRDDVLRLATWTLDSDGAVAPELLTEAARQAGQRFDLALTERLARAAIDAGGPVQARITLAEALFRGGRVPEANDVLDEAARQDLTMAERVRLADTRAHVLVLAGRQPEARRVLTETAAAVDPGLAGPIRTRAAVMSLMAGQIGDARTAAGQIVAAGGGRDALTVQLRVRVDYVEGMALALSGRCDDADRLAGEALTFLRGAADAPVTPEQALIPRVTARLFAGRLTEAAADVRTLEAGMVALGDREGEATAALLGGRVALAAGDVRAAGLMFRRAVAVNRDLADGGALRWSLAGQCFCEALLGDLPAMRRSAAEIPATEPERVGIFEPDLVQRALAWVHVAEGDLDAGRAVLQEAAAAADEDGQAIVALLLRHDLLRLGDRPVAPVLAASAAAMQGGFARAVGLHAEAVRADTGTAWSAAAEAFAGIGAAIETAEVAHLASVALRAEGQSRRATASTRLAQGALARVDGVRTPGLVPPVGAPGAGPTALSARERDVAELAARRLTAGEIAARLHLSTRTVENHLQRVYIKLGIGSRAELARALAHPDRPAG